MSKDKQVRTTSKQNETKNLILRYALKLFNEKGIEYVGVREIANDLNLRVGNVTYYFPVKDEITYAISKQLAELNSKTITVVDGLTMSDFLKRYHQVFENHYQYRCLFISFVQQFEQNIKVQKAYLKTQQARYATLKKNILELVENKFMKQQITENQINFLVSALSLTARFWLSEARVSYKHLSKKKVFKHYLELIAHLLYPYATKQGERQIETFLRSLK
ncbi:MAG: TetR family transcriptional regulator [Fimbriimonadaceae bacterium]|nr:TetR family transcriptional regulator [Chitinophagales bacterium]